MFAFKDKQQNHLEAHMKNGTNADSLPPLISTVLNDPKRNIDNLFADTWKKSKNKLPDPRRRFHQAQRSWHYWGSICIAVEIAQHIFDRDVFKEGTGQLFEG